MLSRPLPSPPHPACSSRRRRALSPHRPSSDVAFERAFTRSASRVREVRLGGRWSGPRCCSDCCCAPSRRACAGAARARARARAGVVGRQHKAQGVKRANRTDHEHVLTLHAALRRVIFHPTNCDTAAASTQDLGALADREPAVAREHNKSPVVIMTISRF